MQDKISITPLLKEHAKDLFALTDANRKYLREWLPWLDSVRTVADTKAFIVSTTQQNGLGHSQNFGVFYEGSICGVAGFHKIDSQQKIGSIGYWLGGAFVGKGIMSEVVKQLLILGFDVHQFSKIEIRCAEANKKSRAIPERLGFVYQATQKDSEWLYSQYVNHAIYTLLASEYHSFKIY